MDGFTACSSNPIASSRLAQMLFNIKTMLFKKKLPQEKIYDQDIVGCFGKLPLHAEFIKHRTAQPNIAKLDQWYQEAYQHLHRQYGQNAKNIFLQMPSYSFITLDASQPLMIGTVMASQDQSGRAYPFVICRLPQHPLSQEFPSLIPLFYQDFFTASKQLSITDLSAIGNTINAFNQTATRLPRGFLLQSALQTLQTTTLHSWWQQLPTASAQQNLAQFSQLALQKIAEFKQALLQQKNSLLRLPLTPNLLPSVLFWLQLLLTTIPKTQQRLHIFWNAATTDHAASLLIANAPLLAENFMYLITQQPNPTVIDLLLAGNSPITNTVTAPTIPLNQNLLQTLPLWSQQLLCQKF
jgi:type VI secretion system protein ImpM